MNDTAIMLNIDSGVGHVVLNRPNALNAMDAQFWADIPRIFNELSDDPSVRAVVISANGPHFTAGMDIKFLASLGQAAEDDPGRDGMRLRQLILDFQASFNAIENCQVPVLSAVHGACIGGGVDLICATDMRYCTDDAYFCIQEINIGMTADVGTLQRMPELIPAGLMAELAYTGRKLDAETALSSGFVTRVYESQESLVENVLEIAHEIAEKSPLAVVGTKEMLRYAKEHSTKDALNYVATWNAAMLRTEDLAAGMRAAAKKEKPQFRNRPKRSEFGA